MSASALSSAAPRAPRALWLLLAGCALVALVARALPGPRTVDDAFITFRYARHIVEGVGFVYNPGVPTLGTTTPLFTLLMSAIARVSGGAAYPIYALVVSAFADAATCVLLGWLAWRAARHVLVAGLVAALWALNATSVTFAIGGMETSVSILWLALAASALAARRDGLFGVAVGLGLLTRIDAALWVLPLGLWQLGAALWRERSWRALPWRAWVAGALVLLPWSAYAWAVFGSPVPNSLGAKSVAYTMPPGSALVRLVQQYATPFFEFDAFGPLGAMVGLAAYVALNLIALSTVARRAPALVPLLAYPWLYIVAFGVANPLIFRWYLAPPMLAWTLGIVLGAWALIERLPRPALARPLALTLLGALWLGTSLGAWTLTPDHGPQRPAPRMAWHAIELHYQAVAERLRAEHGVGPGTRLASADIGAVGYFSRATIIDTVGLVSPELRAYYPLDPALIVAGQNYAIPPALILDAQPDYLVTMEAFVRQGLAADARFVEAYTLLWEVPTDYYGTSMQVWGRHLTPQPPASREGGKATSPPNPPLPWERGGRLKMFAGVTRPGEGGGKAKDVRIQRPPLPRERGG